MRRPIHLVTSLCLAVLAFGTSSAAQTTHTVTLNASTFSPSTLTIQEGDTVDWVWSLGAHNVVSGAGGIPDGIFNSGLPALPPMSFSVTFDSAFLAANPVPGNVYDYYCDVHVGFGMTGAVTVNAAGSPVPALPFWGLAIAVGAVALAGIRFLRRQRN
ncbi:MAG: hypothetical protein CMJ89_12815 [Planctomycetes bacterium]|nr:hypothetical protein [Planctomycetota bacterium]